MDKMTDDVMARIARAQKGTAPAPAKPKAEIIKQSLYLHVGVHNVIRDTAHSMRIPQQEIFRQSIDLWLAEKDLPSWAEIAEAWEQDQENKQ